MSIGQFCALCKELGLLHQGACSLPKAVSVFSAATMALGTTNGTELSEEPVADTEAAVPLPSTHSAPALTFIQFVAAMALLASTCTSFDTSLSTEATLAALCAGAMPTAAASSAAGPERLGLPVQASPMTTVDSGNGVLTSDAFVAFASSGSHTAWLRQLFKMYSGAGSNMSAADGCGAASATAPDDSDAASAKHMSRSLSEDQFLELMKDAGIVPKLLTPAVARAAVAAATPEAKQHDTSKAANQTPSRSAVNFEEFLEVLARCSVHITAVSTLSAKDESAVRTSRNAVVFGTQYSTVAKQLWAAHAKVWHPASLGTLCLLFTRLVCARGCRVPSRFAFVLCLLNVPVIVMCRLQRFKNLRKVVEKHWLHRLGPWSAIQRHVACLLPCMGGLLSTRCLHGVVDRAQTRPSWMWWHLQSSALLACQVKACARRAKQADWPA